MRRRRNYFVKGEKRDALAVFFNNRLAAAESSRRRREADQRKLEREEERIRRREERAAHRESLRQEERLRKAFERADGLLLKYRLNAGLTPWIVLYMGAARCTLKHVEIDLLKPLEKGTKTVVEVIEALAIDVEQDGSTHDDQIALLFDWYDLAQFLRPALLNYLVEIGLPLADIEEGIVKPLTMSQAGSVAELFDAILEKDAEAEIEPFVSQVLGDHGITDELVAPVCVLVREEGLSMRDLEESVIPTIVEQMSIDEHEHGVRAAAFDDTMSKAHRGHQLSRLFSAVILLVGAACLLPLGWLSGAVAGLVAFTLGSFVSSNTKPTGASLALGPLFALLAVFAASIVNPQFESVAVDISILVAVTLLGIPIARRSGGSLAPPMDQRRDAQKIVQDSWFSLVDDSPLEVGEIRARLSSGRNADLANDAAG